MRWALAAAAARPQLAAIGRITIEQRNQAISASRSSGRQLSREPLGGVMIGADALSAFAEIAVGVAGFSAVVVALRPNAVIEGERRWHWGLALLFFRTLGALFFSVLPMILFYADVEEPITWEVSFLRNGGLLRRCWFCDRSH